MSKRRTPIGVHGYYVEVDDEAGTAMVKQSTHRGIDEKERFLFAQLGRVPAEDAAVLAAYRLNDTEDRTPIGSHGYYVVVDVDAGAALLKFSCCGRLVEKARFLFAELGRGLAVNAAVLSAYQLARTAEMIIESNINNEGAVARALGEAL